VGHRGILVWRKKICVPCMNEQLEGEWFSPPVPSALASSLEDEEPNRPPGAKPPPRHRRSAPVNSDSEQQSLQGPGPARLFRGFARGETPPLLRSSGSTHTVRRNYYEYVLSSELLTRRK